MKFKATAILFLVAATGAKAQTGPAWAWSAGKITNNGSVTVKSTNGTSTYTAVQNPVGAVAKTNQSAVTQPPTVIIQATSGGGYQEARPMIATSANGTPPPIPTCPAGYTSVFTGSSTQWSQPFPIFNVGGTRFHWGTWSANSNMTGFFWDGETNAHPAQQLGIGYHVGSISGNMCVK